MTIDRMNSALIKKKHAFAKKPGFKPKPKRQPYPPRPPEQFTFDVVAHYPYKESEPKVGSCHVYWEECDMDIRGIYYNFTEHYTMVFTPDKKRPQEKAFPVIDFADKVRAKIFRAELRKAVIKYLVQEGVLSPEIDYVKGRAKLKKNDEA